MKTRTLLGSLFALGAPLLLSACNESLTASKAGQNVPVSFRIVGEGTLDSTELVQVRSFAGDSAHRTRLDSLVRRWEDGNVSLEVPLGQPLEFRFDGLNRRNDRLVSFWTALGRDTLRTGNRTGSVVALNFSRNDVTPPSSALLGVPSGSQVVPKGDSLLVSLPTGQGSGRLTLPSSLDSVYLAGTALARDSAGGWSFPVTRGKDHSLTVVNPNGTSATWLLAIRSGDIAGPAFTYGLNTGTEAVVKDGIVSFVLPYVVDSSLVLTIANADPKDVPTSLKLGQNVLDVAGSPWTFPVKVPVAGDTAGIQYQLTARDTLDNVTSQLVKVTRPHYAGTPALRWSSPVTGKLWGVQQDTLLLKTVGGDSSLTPLFTLSGFTDNKPTVEMLWRQADSSLWRCIVSLQEKDSGTVDVLASNGSGKSDRLDTVRISRYDPLIGLPPTLDIPLPKDGSWTSLGYVDFSGKAWDGNGGAATVVISDGTGWKDSTISSSTDKSWSLRVSLASVGARNFTLTAHDKNARAAEQSFHRLIQRDTSAPVLSWSGMSMHGDTLWSRTSSLPLQAMFKDTAGGKTCSLTVQLKDATRRFAATPVGANDLWRDTLDVSGLQGISEWIATATDSAGNSTSQIFHVLRDTVKPVITVNSAKTVSGVAGTMTTISTSISDTHLDSVTIGGILSIAPFSRTFTLPTAGKDSTIVIKASDLLGNISTDSILLASIVQAPVQTTGLPSGTSGKEFYSSFSCPDSQASLQTSSGSSWSSFNGSLFVGFDTSLTLRCVVGTKASLLTSRAWTSKDTTFSLPTWAASVPDTSLVIASTPSGTIWLVSSYGSAAYRAKGDSAWHTTTSPLTSHVALNVSGGQTTNGDVWVLGFSKTTGAVNILSLTDTSASLVRTLATTANLTSSPKMWVGGETFGLAYITGHNPVFVLGSTLSIGTPKVFSGWAGQFADRWDSIASVVLTTDGKTFRATGTVHESSWGAGDCGMATMYSAYSDNVSGFHFSGGASMSHWPTAFAMLPDGKALMAVDSFAYGRGVVPYPALEIYSSQAASMPTAAARMGAEATDLIVTASGSHVWIPTRLNTSAPVLCFSLPDLVSSNLPSHTLDNGRVMLAITPWESAYALMSADGTGKRLYRYHRR